MAASYYWLPHFTGRMPSRHLGKVAFWLVFLGFHLTFLPMHLTGLAGMPRRIHTYAAEMGWDLLNLLSSVGGFVQATGFVVFVVDILLHARSGALAPRNPWGAGTLEWAMSTPAPSYNFASIPQIHGPDPLWHDPAIANESATGKFWLAGPDGGRRLTLSTDVLSGRPESVIVLPGSSWIPLTAAVATAGFFLGLLLKLYAAALVSLALTTVCLVCWAWFTGSRTDEVALEARDGEWLPLHFAHAAGAPGWHGLLYTLIADAAILGSLVFGAVYLWAVAPGWPPAVFAVVSPWSIGATALSWLLALLAIRMLRRRLGEEQAHTKIPMGALVLHVLALAVMLAIVVWVVAGLPPASGHAQSALAAALLWYAIVHAGVALLMSLFLCVRWRMGFVSARRCLEPRVVWAFSHYALGSALLCLLLAALPALSR